jgi:hypothetical protein
MRLATPCGTSASQDPVASPSAQYGRPNLPPMLSRTRSFGGRPDAATAFTLARTEEILMPDRMGLWRGEPVGADYSVMVADLLFSC